MGLAPGDIILEINSHHITNAEDLERVISNSARGITLSIIYIRNGSEQKVTGIIQ
jgi:S1-C subfamily serine protease